MRKLFFLILFLTPLFLLAQDNEECRISLKGLSASQGQAGSPLALYGTWGLTQGEKIPVINKGGMNVLEVIDWSPTLIQARVPQHLPPGDYKVGVYCHPVEGGTRSSGFKTFTILGSGDREQKRPVAQSHQPQKKAPSSTSLPSPSASDNESPLDGLLEEFGLADTHIKDYWYYFFLLLLIPIFRSRRDENPSLHGYSSRQEPSTKPTFTAWKGSLVGTPFSVEQYSDETITVEIELPVGMDFQTEVNPLTSMSVPKKIERDVLKLLALGAVYIDVNFNTNRVAAEFPIENGVLSNDKAKKIAFHLVAIKKIIS
ncbi:MAG: hypothetical protein KDD55_08675 [Bdellovibrionales bacterium]|nr:hypothetical protein [Bdellovibrionales bacterium]